MVLNLLTKICKIYTLHCAHNMGKVVFLLFRRACKGGEYVWRKRIDRVFT